MRLAPGTLARRVGLALLAAAALAACGRDDRISADWALAPSAPRIGSATSVRVMLRDADRHPVAGAHLQLEAHMSHPGMAPLVSPAVERDRGVYQGQLQFTMAGDWVLVLTGTLSDGTRFTTTRDIAGVRRPGE